MTGVDAALECCGCSLLLRLHRLVDIYDALHGTSSLGDVAADLTLLTAASSPLCSLPQTPDNMHAFGRCGNSVSTFSIYYF